MVNICDSYRCAICFTLRNETTVLAFPASVRDDVPRLLLCWPEMRLSMKLIAGPARVHVLKILLPKGRTSRLAVSDAPITLSNVPKCCAIFHICELPMSRQLPRSVNYAVFMRFGPEHSADWNCIYVHWISNRLRSEHGFGDSDQEQTVCGECRQIEIRGWVETQGREYR